VRGVREKRMLPDAPGPLGDSRSGKNLSDKKHVFIGWAHTAGKFGMEPDSAYSALHGTNLLKC